MATFYAVDSKSSYDDFAANHLVRIAPEPASANCEWDLQANTWEWDPDLAVVFGRQPNLYIPSAAAILEMKHPDDLAMSKSVLDSVRDRGLEFSYANRIFRADGCVRMVHAAALVSSDTRGLPAVMRARVDVLSDWTLPFSACEVATASDGELMLGLRAGMPEALGEAFRRHSGSVAQVARRFGSSNVDDIVQDVFEGLCRSPDRFDARRGSLHTYLNVAARTRGFDAMRSQTSRRQRDLLSEQLHFALPAEVEALQSLSRLQVQRALSRLRPEERAAIELAFFGGLSYRAVAEHLGVPEGTVKGRIRRGLLHLRTPLDWSQADCDEGLSEEDFASQLGGSSAA
ncbi:MAG TPA: sigma-70 family RNA polymerase sigma factor [Acidimicrobiales bacterium]